MTIGAAQVAPRSRRDLAGLLRAAGELLAAGVLHPFQLIEDNRSVAGVQILLWWDDVAHLRRGMAELLALYASGAVRPVIDSVVPLAEAARAHRRLESRQSVGKILLRCGPGEASDSP